MRKLKVYLDTSVVSYLYQVDAPEKMQNTLDLWELFKNKVYEVYISDIVIREISGCNKEKLKILLDYLDQIDNITHTSHTQTTPETVYFKEFSSENSHAACAKPLATDKTLCK